MNIPDRRRAEAGSAYIVALLVLVVLSLLGLALSLISQSELQIGANELTTHRALYTAEAGVHLAISRVLTANSSVEDATMPAVKPMAFTLVEPRFTYDSSGNPVIRVPADGEIHFGEHVTVSPFVPIHVGPCDGCQQALGDVSLFNLNHAVVTSSSRLTWAGDDNPDQATLDAAAQSAQKQLYLTVGLVPWWGPRWEAIADDVQVQKILQETMGQYSN
jgi:hypothetical protein